MITTNRVYNCCMYRCCHVGQANHRLRTISVGKILTTHGRHRTVDIAQERSIAAAYASLQKTSTNSSLSSSPNREAHGKPVSLKTATQATTTAPFAAPACTHL